MSEELVFNLWAIYDASTGTVYGVSGRAYSVSGTDREKLDLLKLLSRTDYVIAKRYQVSERFEIIDMDGALKTRVAFLNVVYDPQAAFFEELFKSIESELPPIPDFSSDEFRPIPQKIPEDPLCVTTVLYEDEVGNIRPIISDEDREWVYRHESRTHGF